MRRMWKCWIHSDSSLSAFDPHNSGTRGMWSFSMVNGPDLWGIRQTSHMPRLTPALPSWSRHNAALSRWVNEMHMWQGGECHLPAPGGGRPLRRVKMRRHSAVTMVSFPASYRSRISEEHRVRFTFLTASSWAGPQVQAAFLTRRDRSGVESSASDWAYLSSWLAMPKSRLTSVMFLRLGMFMMAWVRSRSCLMPSAMIWFPQKTTEGRINSHLSFIRVAPASLSHWRAIAKLASCCTWPLPWSLTKMLSTQQTMPGTPCIIFCILPSKCSVAELMPNGRRWKQNLLNGVMNVVRSCIFSVRGICQ